MCKKPSQSAPVLCVTGPATGEPAGVATYGGASVAALPDAVVNPPDAGAVAPAVLVVVVVVAVVTGAGAGPDDGAPSALGIGGNPHLTFSCSMLCSQNVLPALPRHAAGKARHGQVCAGEALLDCFCGCIPKDSASCVPQHSV